MIPGERASTSRLLRVYPRAWRLRYGDEFSELLAAASGERPRDLRRTLDVVRGGLVARLTYLGVATGALDPDVQARAGFSAVGCCSALFVLFGAVLWSQLLIGWQWSEPDTPATAAATVLSSFATFLLLALSLLAAVPVLCSLVRRILSKRGDRLVVPSLLVVASSVALFLGGQHFGNGWPGTGGHHWAHQGLVPGGLAAFAWASTLSVSSYWAHPAALSHFPASELAWMATSPLGLVVLLTSLVTVLRRLPLSPAVLRYEVRLAAAARGVMALFFAACALWVLGGGTGPHSLFRVGAIDVIGLVVMALALAGTSGGLRATSWSLRSSTGTP